LVIDIILNVEGNVETFNLASTYRYINPEAINFQIEVEVELILHIYSNFNFVRKVAKSVAD